MSIKDALVYYKTECLPAELIAVSKRKPESDIQLAYDAGQRHFGENYIQELVSKAEQLPKDIYWHFIGHLQSNKVKYIAAFVHLIHAVDSIKLLVEINKQAEKNNRQIAVLLQIHIAQEDSKFGIPETELESFSQQILSLNLSHIIIKGLMTMASNTDDLEQVNLEFSKVKKLSQKLQQSFPEAKEISMGMSGDYKLALSNGRTMVRIGSAIFGERA